MAKESEVKVDVSGLERLLREEPDKVEKWLNSVAESIVTDVKLSFGSSPPGRTYTRTTSTLGRDAKGRFTRVKGAGVTHVASQPGYPPNVDIGTLIGSIRQEKTGTLEYQVMDGTEYGIYLEDGTEHIDPRPFMRPAFDRARQTVERDAASGLGLEK